MTDGRRFTSQPHRRARGQVGEDAARDWLVAQGYEVVARNVRNKAGEIDLVARHGEILCFVEIKARSTSDYGSAIAAVPRSKQRRLARTAALYLSSKRWQGACRFDVLGLDLKGDGEWDFTLVQDAFSVPSGSFGGY